MAVAKMRSSQGRWAGQNIALAPAPGVVTHSLESDKPQNARLHTHVPIVLCLRVFYAAHISFLSGRCTI